MSSIPLAFLDLVPISSGSNPGEALRSSLDLVRRAEDFGYSRYWFAEHHLNPGVAGTSPAVLLALAASTTSSIRLGAAAVQMGHRTALSVLEEFGLIDALHPGRLDLGLGRSGGAPPNRAAGAQRTQTEVLPGGLRLPPPVSLAHLATAPRIQAQKDLLLQPGATAQPYSEQIDDLLALLAGSYVHENGVTLNPVPGADLQLWIHGSSGGESAHVAGRHGLRFGANYHVAPAGILEAVAAYREAFVPSAELPAPHVIVSADVVVAEDSTQAHRLAAGYRPWVYSIRSGAGAIEYPTPEAAQTLGPSADDPLVADRLETQFVGTAGEVADRLASLQEATGADELLVTTITHDPQDRARSLQLLAKEWQQR